MIELLKYLNLSDKAIFLYQELIDGSSLTLSEIHLLKPDF